MTRSPRSLPAAAALLITAVLATAVPVTAVLVTTAPPAALDAAAAGAGRTAARTVRLDGVGVRLREDTRQVVTARRTTGHRARVTYWVRTGDRWQPRFTTADGRLGYGGLSRPARRHQGDGTTPLGTYDLLSAFGTHPRRAGWRLDYHRIHGGDYWVGDNRSPYYNRLRNRSRGGFRWWLPASDHDASERLRDYPGQYEYSIVTGFNAEQVRERGFAIFLHVNGSGATAGCVSVPRATMRRLVNRLDPARHPVIAIGR